MDSKTGYRLRLTLGLLLIIAAVMTMVYRDRDGSSQPYQLAQRDDGMYLMTGETMGRIPYRILAWPGDLEGRRLRYAFGGAHQALDRVNRVMSAYLPDSDLRRVNEAKAGKAVVVDGELFKLLLIARDQSEATDGAFDPTARKLFRTWSSAGKADRLPTDAELAAAREDGGWDKVTLNEADHSVTKSVDGLQIDLGAIAKGYAVDRAAAALKEAGIAGALVEVGGEVRIFGANPPWEQWAIAVQHPFDLDDKTGAPFLCGALSLTDRSVATSGNYRRFSEIGGKRYSHIIDPRTGQPADAVPSVTVIAADCMTADAWSTSLSVLGEAGLKKVEAIDNLEAMLIIGDADAPRVVATSGFDQYVDVKIELE